MKVLVIRPAGKISGAEIYNLNLLKGLKKYKDLEISFITDLKEFSQRVVDLGVKSFCLTNPVKEIGTKRDLLKTLLVFPKYITGYLKTIKKLEQGGKFDLVILQSMTEKIFLTPILKLKSYKVIWIEHGPLFATNRSEIIKLFYRLISKRVDKIITVSQDTKEDLIRGGVRENKIETIYIGIDTKYFSILKEEEKKKIRAKLNIPSKSRVIGFLGTITEEKGIREFIETADIILKKEKNFFFLLVGEGSLLSWVKKEVKGLKIDNKFYFAGKVNDVKQYLGIMDLLFFPTRHNEGVSMAILEAMSMEVLVMAHDIGGNRELIINGETGYLFDEFDKNKLAGILSDKTNSQDIVRHKARNSIKERFNITTQSKFFYKLFSSI